MLKASLFAILLVVGVSLAAPSITDYHFTIDGTDTSASVVYISPLSSSGVKDGVHFNITANETVDWSLNILDQSGTVKMSAADSKSKTLQRPISCPYWSGTSNQCPSNSSIYLTEGSYTVNVSVSYFINSSANGTITDSTRTIVIDNTPPSISIQSPSGYSSKNVNVNFIASDSSGVSGCVMEWTNQSSIIFNKTLLNCNNETLGADDGNHTVRIWATDNAGNAGVATVSFIIDSVAPYVSVSSPTNSTYNTSSIDFNFTASDTNMGSCVKELDNDNTTISCANATISAISKGSHILRLWVNDSSGNTNVSTVFFTSSYTAPMPSIIIDNPANKTYGTASIQLSYTTSGKSCSYSLNNGANATIPGCANTTLTNLSDSSYFLQVFANDSGSVNLSNVSFTIDTTAPDLTINEPRNVTYTSTSVSLAYTTSGTSCYYELNGVSNSPSGCTSTATTIPAVAGFNKLILYSKDQMNNTNSTSVSFTVTLPATSSSPPPSQGTTQNTNQKTVQNNTQKPSPAKNQSIVNVTVGPVNPPLPPSGANQSKNATSGSNLTSPATGAFFSNPLPISLEFVIIVAIVIAALLWKFAIRRPKTKEGVVVLK